MSTKKIISWLLLLFGEAIIITSFILFRGTIPDNILVLNIVVSSIIYGLFFVDILVPWVDLKDKSQKRVGSLGLRWFVTWVYAIVAIAVMTGGNVVYEFTFTTQLIIQFILLFCLLLGLLGTAFASDKVEQVYEQQTINRSGMIEMSNAMRRLNEKVDEIRNFPPHFTRRIKMMEENLRFLAPSDKQEAHELEHSFVETVENMAFVISDLTINKEQIELNLKKLERLYQNRKNSI